MEENEGKMMKNIKNNTLILKIFIKHKPYLYVSLSERRRSPSFRSNPYTTQNVFIYKDTTRIHIELIFI